MVNTARQAAFWSKVVKTDTCWLWTGRKNKKGYGTIKVDGRSWTTHRLSYYLETGVNPALYVLHHCDVRNCVNPAHLYAGTQTDNMRDMLSRGRGNKARGERVNTAKLTAEQVVAIRAAHAAGGISYVELGRQYGMSDVNISSLVRRLSWKHVT
jgi:hypothetical protein